MKPMKSMNKRVVICAATLAFLLCAALPPDSSALPEKIVWGNAYIWNSYKQQYTPINGLTVKLECSTGTFYDTTHYDPYHGNGYYVFLYVDVGLPDGGTVSITYDGCTYNRSFAKNEITAHINFYLDSC
jgi:hypothetical protein